MLALINLHVNCYLVFLNLEGHALYVGYVIHSTLSVLKITTIIQVEVLAHSNLWGFRKCFYVSLKLSADWLFLVRSVICSICVRFDGL